MMTPQNNIPPDMDALLAWLKERALEAHNKTCTICLCRQRCTVLGFETCSDSKEERIYNRVIAKIENSRVNQRPHVPLGWDEV